MRGPPVCVLLGALLLTGCMEPADAPTPAAEGSPAQVAEPPLDGAIEDPIAEETETVEEAPCSQIGDPPDRAPPDEERAHHTFEASPDRASGGGDFRGAAAFVTDPSLPMRFEWDLDEASRWGVQLVAFEPDSPLARGCFAVVAPDGERWTPDDDTGRTFWVVQPGEWTAVFVMVVAPEDGTWTLEVSDLPERQGVGVMGHVTSPYELVVENGLARVGEPHVVEVSVVADAPLRGVDVTARLVDVATGSSEVVEFRDDGQHPDAVAEDGIHTAVHTFASSGEHELHLRAVAPEVARQTVHPIAVVDGDWNI